MVPKPEELQKAPKVRVEDPIETLVDAFNTRTQGIVDSIDSLDKHYQQQLDEIKQQLKDSLKSFNRIMVGIIIVLILGFIAMLIAIISVIVTSTQFGTQTYQQQQQADGIQKVKDQQDKMNSTLQTIQQQTAPKN